jgi:hypothetical protein
LLTYIRFEPHGDVPDLDSFGEAQCRNLES